jgi:23S rRNA pseudouridine1911/1915/1917 synthase
MPPHPAPSAKPSKGGGGPQRASTANPTVSGDRAWVIPAELHQRPLDGVVRTLLEKVSWGDARRLVETGKVRLAGEVCTDSTRRVRAGDKVTLTMSAPRPDKARARELEEGLIVYLDASVVVVRKPPGISTVPFGDEGSGEVTLDALVREALAHKGGVRGRAPLGVVQRLDRATSGILVFARTFAAKKHLGNQLRFHTMTRRYLAIAHGDVASGTHRSHLIEDRGDGLRGSARDRQREGQLAVTHVERVERLEGATLVACRLETGRTHQIRIHLSESGHPLVGEAVYVRGFRHTLIPAPRLMLHAAELGFAHPSNERPMSFSEPPPKDFEQTLARLRVGRSQSS